MCVCEVCSCVCMVSYLIAKVFFCFSLLCGDHKKSVKKKKTNLPFIFVIKRFFILPSKIGMANDAGYVANDMNTFFFFDDF